VGYLNLRKNALSGRQRTWVCLTPKGRKAFAAHVAALRSVVGLASDPQTSGRDKVLLIRDRLLLSGKT